MQPNMISSFLDAIPDPGLAGSSDAALLERVSTAGDEAAFRQLVCRHGPMVLGVCRRILYCPHDVEDAFQATFLVLARKSGSLSHQSLLGNWLYGVAYRTALDARKRAARRAQREREAASMCSLEVVEDHSWSDVRPVLDSELNRLATKYREAIVLCDIQGLSRKEVAKRLGVAEGTLSSRLARGREWLRERLQRRGVSLSLAALVTGLSSSASAEVPEQSLQQAMENFSSLPLSTPLIPPGTLSLAHGALKAMYLSRLKTAVLILGLAMAFTGGVGWLWYGPLHGSSSPNGSTLKAGEPKKKPVALPRDTKRPILTYDVEGGFLPRKQEAPYVDVFADGRVIATDPRSTKPGIEIKLSTEELQALLSFIVHEQKFLDLKTEAIKKAIQAKQPGRRLLGPEVDAVATVIQLRTATKSNEIKLYALETYAKKYPKIPSLQQLQAVAKRMAQLQLVTWIGGSKKLRQALTIVDPIV